MFLSQLLKMPYLKVLNFKPLESSHLNYDLNTYAIITFLVYYEPSFENCYTLM